MAYASRAGRAHTNPRKPAAQAVCDRCGIWTLHNRLAFQYQWAGSALQNLRLLVCNRCLDTPQEQLRALVLSADPIPINNPRTEPFVQDSTTAFVTTGPVVTDFWTGIPIPSGSPLVDANGNPYVPQQTGVAQGSLNEEPGTDPNVPGDDDPGLPYGNTSVPKTGGL